MGNKADLQSPYMYFLGNFFNHFEQINDHKLISALAIIILREKEGYLLKI
jgi:hypothetical protein